MRIDDRIVGKLNVIVQIQPFAYEGYFMRQNSLVLQYKRPTIYVFTDILVYIMETFFKCFVMKLQNNEEYVLAQSAAKKFVTPV